MTARRGAARRGEARRGERRPRATSAMREARRGTKGEEEVGRLLRYGSSRVVRGGGSGRKGRGIPPLPSPPPTDHLYTLPTYLPTYPTLSTLVARCRPGFSVTCLQKKMSCVTSQDVARSAGSERRREKRPRSTSSFGGDSPVIFCSSAICRRDKKLKS